MSPDQLPEPFVDIDLPLADRREGKVRVSYRLDSAAPTRLFVTTDRLSAFDRNIAGIPYKGQVLNQLAAWWFARTADDRRQPRRRRARSQRADRPRHDAAAGRGGRPRGDHRGDVDVAVAALRRRSTDDLRLPLPDGLRKNTLLPEPIVTPTTKPAAGSGAHDEPLTWAEVVERGLVPGPRWEQLTAIAVELFTEGQRIAAEAGLILADTKYEFGVTERRRGPADRRGAHAGLVALLGRRHL